MGRAIRNLLIIGIVIYCAMPSANAQNDYRRSEFSLANENDVYTLTGSDRYYSNGIIANYRFVPRKGSLFNRKGKPDSIKYMVGFQATHKFFTPDGIKDTNIENLDRPYAGELTVSLTFTKFLHKRAALAWGVQTGLIGPGSGGGNFQTWYHRVAGFPEPLGWHLQLRNEPILNLQGKMFRQFILDAEGIDIISSSLATIGTSRIHAVQRFDLRFGELRALNSSSFVNSLIGEGSSGVRPHFYLFAGWGVEYVVHNSLIEGSMLGIESPHTERALPWVRHFRLGWAANSSNTTFRMTVNSLSEEVKDARNHTYVGFELSIRFRAPR